MLSLSLNSNEKDAMKHKMSEVTFTSLSKYLGNDQLNFCIRLFKLYGLYRFNKDHVKIANCRYGVKFWVSILISIAKIVFGLTATTVELLSTINVRLCLLV